MTDPNSEITDNDMIFAIVVYVCILLGLIAVFYFADDTDYAACMVDCAEQGYDFGVLVDDECFCQRETF
jgi:hypothetical protein